MAGCRGGQALWVSAKNALAGVALLVVWSLAAGGCSPATPPAAAGASADTDAADGGEAEVSDSGEGLSGDTSAAAEDAAELEVWADADASASDTGTALGDAATAADACAAVDCGAATVCQPLETSCNGQILRVCAADGASWQDKPCSPGSSCGATGGQASCQPWVCLPGASTCTDSAAVVCAPSGLTATVADDCAQPDGAGKPRQCVGGVCLPFQCVPGDAQCAGSATVAVCSSTGAGWQAVPCPTTKACKLKWCTAVVCKPGAAGCVSGGIGKCSALGTDWELSAACPANTYCVEESNPLICDIFKCPLGGSACGIDGSLLLCSPDGSKWLAMACEPGKMCLNGGCQPAPSVQTYPIAPPAKAPSCVGKCPSEPACSPDDGCGAPCPGCMPGPQWAHVCHNGTCAACPPSCAGKLCGPDGCGGWCGSCPESLVCSGSACVTACSVCPPGGCKMLGFEKGMTGWTPGGEAAVTGQFAGELPPTGKGMLRLFSGFISVTSGTATTELCPAATTSKLRLKWRFCSTEFNGFCTGPYQDRWWIRLRKGGTPVELFAAKVEDFCKGDSWYATAVPYKLGEDSMKCSPWQQTTIDIAAFLPNPILTLGIGNVGDGGHPSAVLIDDIEFLP